MWRIIWYLQGYVRAKIKGASPEWALGRLTDARVACIAPVRTDEFTVELLLLKRDLPKAEFAVQRGMCELEIIREIGLARSLGGLLRRRGFAALLALCVAGAVIVPRFVFFYEVVGNETVPDAQILRALKSLGVGFGTYGPGIHPQELKNKMLLLVPKLQWFTVQQNGMRARVVVRERPEKLPVEERRAPIDVVASRDGVITSVSALEGNCLCAPGQAVKEGQVLISAYTDLEFTTRVCAALGEVYAQTLRFPRVAVPETVLEKLPNGKNGKTVSLLVGEKRWIIFANGGNLDGSCDKITKTNWLTLPGGFRIPLGLEITGFQGYDTQEKALDEASAQALAQEQALGSIQQDMIAGRILETKSEMDRHDGVYEWSASVRCEEMIARMVRASILKEETIP